MTRGEQLVVIGHSTDAKADRLSPEYRAYWIKRAAADLIDLIELDCPPGRWRSEAVTNIENGCGWAVKSLFNPAPDPPEQGP